MSRNTRDNPSGSESRQAKTTSRGTTRATMGQGTIRIDPNEGFRGYKPRLDMVGGY